jgi:hypothetical protein
MLLYYINLIILNISKTQLVPNCDCRYILEQERHKCTWNPIDNVSLNVFFFDVVNL